MSDSIRRFPLNQVRAREYHDTVRKLQAERTTAPKLVDDALRVTLPHDWSALAGRPELRSAGAIEHLGELVTAQMTREPAYAERLARLAVSLAEAIAPGTYPRTTMAQVLSGAWKDYGKVLSYLARHDEAIDAFAQAEGYIDAVPYDVLAHDRAIIQLNVAITYQDTARYSEALAIFGACKEVFRRHGDRNLSALSAFYEGAIFQRLHKYRDAREAYLLLIASANDIAKGTLAALHQGIGLCSIELGDYEAAEDNFTKAISLHRQLGQTLDALRGDHGCGKLLIRRGLSVEGVTRLRSVRHHYLKFSLAEEAGLCGLEMVEGMLALGDSAAAEALARTILNEFLAAGLNARAITALGYLTEAIAVRNASPATATGVRDYILSLRATPEREFQPMVPPTGGG